MFHRIAPSFRWHRWVFLSLLLVLGGCAQKTRIIKIGVLAPLSGQFAETSGQGVVTAVQMAVDEVNDAGGLEVNGNTYQIVLVVEDDQASPETAVSAARKLINQDEVIAIIGPPFSSTAIPVADVAEQSAIPMISPTSTNPKTTEGKTYVFRATFVDDFQGAAMASFAINDLGISKAAILFDVADAYNRGLAASFSSAFESLGGEIVSHETYTTDENQDFGGQLERIKAAGAEALFLPNNTDDVLRQGEQAEEIGLDVTILGSDAWEGERLSGNSAFENAFFSGHFCRDNRVERIRAFNEDYESGYGREPNGLIALSYDAIKMIFSAMENQGQVTSQAVMNGLNSMTFHGVTGEIKYEGTGDPVKSVAIWKIENGDRGCYSMITP